MSNTIMVLTDGTRITMGDNSSMFNVQVTFPDKDTMIAIWDKLTTPNLKRVELQIDGEISAEYTDLVLDDERSVVRPDGSIITEFHLREKTELEKLREEVETLKSGQGVQDGAITDAAYAIGEIMEMVSTK